MPFKVLSGSTAELGKHFLVKDEATSFIVPKDGNTATLTLLPGPDADLANPATLKLGVDEQGGRFVAGETASVTVTVKGLLSYAALAGTWHCKELIGLEMLELFAMEEDLDTSKIPSNNDDFTITITAGGARREIHAVEHGRSGQSLPDVRHDLHRTVQRAGGQSERVLYDGRRAIFLGR